MIEHLKKGDMAQEAERLLAGTGWPSTLLPTPGGNAATAERAAEDHAHENDPLSETALDLPASPADDGEAADDVYSVAAE